MIAFYLDESTKNAIAIALGQRGINITTTSDAKLLGASDEAQLYYAFKNKRMLYFEQGANEFWLCTEKGDMQFFNLEGELERSSLVPDFPQRIEL
jgi:hypothetical protein